jgi:hypothetical protein
MPTRLQTALQGEDRFEIDACQTYWLRVAETLRRKRVSLNVGISPGARSVTLLLI